MDEVEQQKQAGAIARLGRMADNPRSLPSQVAEALRTLEPAVQALPQWQAAVESAEALDGLDPEDKEDRAAAREEMDEALTELFDALEEQQEFTAMALSAVAATAELGAMTIQFAEMLDAASPDGRQAFLEWLREVLEEADVVPASKVCACGCGQRFVPARTDQVYATSACRVRVWRRARNG
jgi:hypothetical protein